MSKKSFVDDLADFFEEHKDIEVSFQSKRNFTKPELLREYILDLEGAVRYFSNEQLDKAMSIYRTMEKDD